MKQLTKKALLRKVRQQGQGAEFMSSVWGFGVLKGKDVCLESKTYVDDPSEAPSGADCYQARDGGYYYYDGEFTLPLLTAIKNQPGWASAILGGTPSWREIAKIVA